MTNTNNTLTAILLTLASPATLLLGDIIWLGMRLSSPVTPKVDKYSGMTRREHAYFNPGIPFRPM